MAARSDDGGGHLFVVRGDVTALACDAWLVPSDAALHVEPYWHQALGLPRRTLPRPSGRAVVPMAWDAPDRRPWLVDVVDESRRIDNARAFVAEASAEVRRRGAPVNERAKPLLALPLVGTGRGGGREIAGRIVFALLPALVAEARARDVDVALVLDKPEAFAAAQKQRLGSDAAFALLDADLVARADALAERARAGELVLFLGAGASRASGVPLWREMLRNVARACGIGDAELARLSRLSPLDQAQLLQTALALRGERLIELVVRQVEATHHSITHALLASLPVREVVTTNYDDLFERAWRGRGARFSVLPNGPRDEGERFVLKLHGCISSPSQIVLTREDYLRYLESRAALVGIVQSLLLTRHMLFVGSSLEDESFHRIVHDVRKAARLGGDASTTFGTVLDLVARPYVQQLWHDLDWIAFQREGEDEPTPEITARAARTMEIFLDRLVASATTSSEYLLSTGYEGADPAEQRLRERLLELIDDRSLHVADAWSEVEALAARLGHPHARGRRSSPPGPPTAPTEPSVTVTRANEPHEEPPTLPDDPLEAAIAAARFAGDVLRRELHREGGPRGEGDKAEVDAEIERALQQMLARAFPDHGFQGEETSPATPETPRFWCVDPNDGTRAFLRGERGFAVSIALVDGGVPVVGVVHAPAFPDDGGDLIAWREGGPLLRASSSSGAGGALEPVTRSPLATELSTTDVIAVGRGAEKRARENLRCVTPARFRPVPSVAYRLALVAAGETEAAVMLDASRAWDLAAGHALLRAVGGEVHDLSGQPVRYSPFGAPARSIGGSGAMAELLAVRAWQDVRNGRIDPPLDEAPVVAPTLPRRGEAIEDRGLLARAQGALLGLLAGDSLGQRVEFLSRDEIAARFPDGVRELVDGGTWDLMAGQPTDDGELALVLARVLCQEGAPAHAAILEGYRAWMRDAFDVGGTIGRALRGAPDPESEANGSLMRVAPIGVFAHALPEDAVAELAREESGRTHASRVCRDACAVYCVAIAHAVRTGAPPRDVFDATLAWARRAAVDPIVVATLAAAGATAPLDFQRHQGWVRIALQNAFHRLVHAASFAEGVVDTVHEGGDTDTNGAIVGALLGAVHGREAIPARWRRLVLSARPVEGLAKTRHPRPRAYWPIDALVLAERLLVVGRRFAQR